MNYKQMLDKIAELEARIQALEQGQMVYGKTSFSPASTPAWVQQQPWPNLPNISIKGILQ